MEKGNKFDFKLIITVTGALLSFMIGAGTCSGQELMQFSVSFGYWGIGVILVSLVLNAFLGAALLDTGRTLRAESSKQVYQYFLGNKLGIILDYFTIIMVFLIFVVMLAGAGSTLTQYTGMDELLGRAVVTVIVLATVLLGLQRFIKILGCIGPVIIVFGVAIGLVSFIQNFDGFLRVNEVMQSVQIPHLSGVNFWWLSGIMYVTFTVIVALPFFSKVGSEIEVRKNAIASGIGFGIGFTLIAGTFYLAMLASAEHVYDKPIPTLALAEGISPIFALMFTVLILLGIYSTAVPMCWTVCDRIAKTNKRKYNICAVIVCIIGFFGALFPFATIINVVYPWFGWIGIIVYAAMIFRVFIKKGNIEKYSSKTEIIMDVKAE